MATPNKRKDDENYEDYRVRLIEEQAVAKIAAKPKLIWNSSVDGTVRIHRTPKPSKLKKKAIKKLKVKLLKNN